MVKSFLQKLFKKKIEMKDKTHYQPLYNVLAKILIPAKLEEKKRAEIEAAAHEEYNRQYFNENRGDIAVSRLLHALRDNSQGEIDQTVTLINWQNKLKPYNLKAYITDSESIEIMQEYAENAKKYGNAEGYTFKFAIDPDFSQIEAPCCKCEFVSDTFTIDGNFIDSNCDVWGTSYGVKAESLYLLFVKDLNKLAIVQVRYWVV